MAGLDTQTLSVLTDSLDLAGVVASSLLGGAIARSVKLDLFGFVVVGSVSGLGGGILRDTLLQNGAPLALVDPRYIPAALLGALVAFFIQMSERTWDRLFTVLDAAVIGFWAVAGVQRTFEAGLGWLPAILMGTTTAVGGGAIRDLILRRVPAVLGGNALYASVAVASSSAMVIAYSVGAPTIGIVSAILLSLLLRVAAVRWGWGLPNGRNWQPRSALATLMRAARARPDLLVRLRKRNQKR